MPFASRPTQFLSFTTILQLDIGFLPLACMFPLNFHMSLLINTLVPMGILGLLFSTPDNK